MAYSSEIVTLNVGGVIYTTSSNTLTTDPDSMLGVMFSGKFSAQRNKQGQYFIDADGKLFQHILNFLRRNTLVLPKNFDKYGALLIEAEYFQIQPMIEAIRCVTDSQVLSLNVGGIMYDVSANLLDKYPTSKLNCLARKDIKFDSLGNCFIDADGSMFQHVLNYLRRDELMLPNDFKEFDLLLMEAEFYGIEPLLQCIRNVRHQFDVISINVDGVLYHTTLKTLQRYPNTSLCRMLRSLDEKGRYSLQGNGELFRYILDYLRKGQLELPLDFKSHEKLLEYACFYDIPPLVQEIQHLKELDGGGNS